MPQSNSTAHSIDSRAECAPEDAGLSRAGIDRIWAALAKLYETKAYPAIAFVLRRGGRVVMQRALGFSHGGDHAPKGTLPRAMTADTPTCLFSTSKAVTATLVHILHEKGALDVNRRVAEYLPEFAQNGKSDITVADILNHRAGLSGFSRKGMTSEIFDTAKVVALLCAQKPEWHTKGAVAYHAVTGGFILGEIVARATGHDLRYHLNHHIRKPMGFEWFDYGAPGKKISLVAENRAVGLTEIFPMKQIAEYAVGSSVKSVVDLSYDDRFYTSIIPSANMVATATEAAEFFQMLLDGGEYKGKRIMRSETIDKMTRETGNTWLDRRIMMPMRYSEGFMLGNSPVGLYGPNTKQAFGHLGFMNILCWADPERKTAVAFLNTGKSLGGPHLVPYAEVLRAISEVCA